MAVAVLPSRAQSRKHDQKSRTEHCRVSSFLLAFWMLHQQAHQFYLEKPKVRQNVEQTNMTPKGRPFPSPWELSALSL